VDKRLGKGLDRKRALLYITDERRVMLEKMLVLMPIEVSRTLSAAIFEVIRQWLKEKEYYEGHDGKYIIVRRDEMVRVPQDTDSAISKRVKFGEESITAGKFSGEF